MAKKNVILLIIDTLMLPFLKKAVDNKMAPAFAFFMKHGTASEIISPFPTMSVNVESSLLTGHYSDVHHVPGLVWFHDEEKRLINYGTNASELLQLGLATSLKDPLYNINHEHLNKKAATIFEELSKKGKNSASINGLLYRGSQEKVMQLPFLLSLLPTFHRSLTVKGPDLLTYGSFIKQNPFAKYGHFWQRFGFNNRFSAQELIYLIKNHSLPPFTMVYFPDMDQIIHKKGVEDLSGIVKTDRELQKVLDSFHSWEEALENNVWIIMGDNGQAVVRPRNQNPLIHLEKLLSPYRITKLSKGVRKDDDIVLAVNQRMAFVYLLQPNHSLEEIANILKTDARIDVIAWREEEEKIKVVSGRREGMLMFKKGGQWEDPYGSMWTLNGDIEVLDIFTEGSRIKYGEYPDALARLHAAALSHKGQFLMISAYPGFEFKYGSSPVHVGGASHGGLHQHDSLAAIIVSGTKRLPKYNRMIDVKDWILSMLDS
ncbi:alkaline phosphatase family protein [Aeribacillus composti]|uniref:alkaline phosphatase family protein n=1 Tax=Aeribacillus composti TaxID=1868734 RepID=UPI003D253C81